MRHVARDDCSAYLGGQMPGVRQGMSPRTSSVRYEPARVLFGDEPSEAIVLIDHEISVTIPRYFFAYYVELGLVEAFDDWAYGGRLRGDLTAVRDLAGGGLLFRSLYNTPIEVWERGSTWDHISLVAPSLWVEGGGERGRYDALQSRYRREQHRTSEGAESGLPSYERGDRVCDTCRDMIRLNESDLAEWTGVCSPCKKEAASKRLFVRVLQIGAYH